MYVTNSINVLFCSSFVSFVYALIKQRVGMENIMEIIVVILVLFIVVYEFYRKNKNYVSLDGIQLIEGKKMTSNKYALTGKPSKLALLNGEYVPVVFRKESKNPIGKALQYEVLTYCLLMEEEGQKPSMGLIASGNLALMVSFNDKAKDDLLSLIQEIRDFEVNHPASTIPTERFIPQKNKCGKCFRTNECKML